MALPWGYGPDNGPDHWTSVAPAAGGHHQSPIDIHPASAVYDKNLLENPLCIRYKPTHCKSVLNTSRSLQVVVESDMTNLSGGPLDKDEYILKQFHFHWGSSSEQGAEHTIDGKRYASELHLVHWNKSKFSSFEEAASQRCGLCVLAVFLQVGDGVHNGLKQLTDIVSKVEYSHDSIALEAGFDPTTLLPEDLSRYWTYEGSLTTPPCFESVRFVIFKEPINVSESQLDAFRSLKMNTRETAGQCCQQMVDNFRPVQPLNDRIISASFRKFFT